MEQADIDDIIGLAARMRQEDIERLTVEELEEVGQELGIEARYVAQAVETLRSRRAAAEAEARAAARRRRRLLLSAGLALAGVVALVVVTALVGRSSLHSRLAQVEQQRAQVMSVRDRQRHIAETLTGAAQSSEREAELIGSENRVRVETKRYDGAAAEYNRQAVSLSGTAARWFFDLPARVPLSSDGDI
ncbi:MAG: hypothetical protein Tsb0020_21990 [Haliangiales bacterium]